MRKSFTKLIEENGMNLTGAARVLGKSYSSIASYHNGRRTAPDDILLALHRRNAAGDMYEALKHSEMGLQILVKEDQENKGARESLRLTREALAKAEGKET